MTSVHTVRVTKFAFFFSYSLWGCSGIWPGQHFELQTEKTREGEGYERTEGGPSSLVVLPLSLYSDMLCESLRTRGLLALRA
jgi:hypothetical protein